MEWLHKYNTTRQDKNAQSEDEFDLFMQLSEKEEFEVDTGAAWEKVIGRIQPKTSVYPWILKVAAIVLLAVGLSWGAFELTVPNIGVQYVSVEASDQKENVVLPDGSNVILARGSSIRYPENNSRRIFLTGKAFFDVTKNQEDFVVNAGEVSITVLGTMFSVSSDKKVVDLFVEEGKVSFSHGDTEVIVQPNQQVYYSYSREKLFRNKHPNPNILSWKTGHFTFDDTPIREVFKYIKDYYQVDFANSDIIENCKVTAEFDNQPLSQVLETLGTILNVEITQQESVITIKGSGCN